MNEGPTPPASSAIRPKRATGLIKSFGSFVLGLFANQLANNLAWPAFFTLVIVAAFFCVAYLLEGASTAANDRPAAALPPASRVGGRVSALIERLFQNVLSTAPFGFVLGSVTAGVSVLPLFSATRYASEFLNFAVWSYELLCFGLNVAVLVAVSRIKTDAIIRIALASSLGLGSGVSVALLRSSENLGFYTIISWIIAMLIAIFALRHFPSLSLAKGLRFARDQLTKPRD